MLVIKHWQTRIENSRTADLKRMAWMPMSTDYGSDFQLTLLDHEHGAQHLACWFVMCQIAAGQPDPAMRGQLARSNGTPHDRDSLARMSRIPAKYFEGAITRLRSKDLDAIDDVTSLPPHCHDVAATLPRHGDDAATPRRDVAATQKLVATTVQESRGDDRAVEDTTKKEREEGAASPPRSPAAIAAKKPEATPNDLEAVVNYGKAIRLGRGECEKFYDHFSANGWKQGGKAAMKDWQAALRNWKRRAKDFGGEPDQKPPMSEEELDRIIIEAWEQDNGPDLVRRAKEQAAREQAEKEKQNGGSL